MSFYKKMHLFLERQYCDEMNIVQLITIYVMRWTLFTYCDVDHNQYVVLQEDASLFRTSHIEMNIVQLINIVSQVHLFLERHISDEHCSVDHNQYSFYKKMHLFLERHILWWDDEHCSVDHNQYVVLQEDASLFRTSHIVMRWTLFSWSQSICRSTRRCISF